MEQENSRLDQLQKSDGTFDAKSELESSKIDTIEIRKLQDTSEHMHDDAKSNEKLYSCAKEQILYLEKSNKSILVFEEMNAELTDKCAGAQNRLRAIEGAESKARRETR